MVFVNSLLFWGLAISLAGALWVDTDNQTVMDSHRETYKVPTMRPTDGSPLFEV